jgi:hypothetical protein
LLDEAMPTVPETAVPACADALESTAARAAGIKLLESSPMDWPMPPLTL